MAYAVGFVITVINELTEYLKIFSADLLLINALIVIRFYEAVDLAIKALETLDDVNHKVYRNERCANKGKCIDYIGYHCAGCDIKENKE